MNELADRPSIALVTISYAPDFERCRLLVDSIRLRAQDAFMHYVVVDQADVALFSSLRSARCTILVKEDLLPWWIFRTRWSGRYWISLRGVPIVRGWIVQQLAKLSIFSAIPEDIAVCCDSDCFFLRDFSLRELVLDAAGRLRFLQVPFDNAENRHWNALSARLLRLPAAQIASGSFVTQLVPFRRQAVLGLLDRLAGPGKWSPIRLLAGQRTFSEYSLYGTYVTQVTGLEGAGHRLDNASQIKMAYGLDPQGIGPKWEQFFSHLGPGEVGGMIHSKDGISVSRYRDRVLRPDDAIAPGN